MSYLVCATRLSDKTYNENERWKDCRKLTFEKRFYNTSIKIKENIPINNKIIVIEMNITKNKVIAFGLIKNICQIWRYSIYSDDYYNRYTYITSKFLFVQEIPKEYAQELEQLKNNLFKGKGHIKRGYGIQQCPKKYINSNLFHYIYETIK